jgi:hypothetical protein
MCALMGGCETSRNVQAPPVPRSHAQAEIIKSDIPPAEIIKSDDPPAEDSINRAIFEKIRIGMTEAEVSGILGRQSDRGWSWSTMGTHSYCWNGANVTITVDFESAGKVIGKRINP